MSIPRDDYGTYRTPEEMRELSMADAAEEAAETDKLLSEISKIVGRERDKESMTQALECQLFTWEDWDGDGDRMEFTNVTLKRQAGNHPPGTKFDTAILLFDRSRLQLSKQGEWWEFMLNLSIGVGIKI